MGTGEEPNELAAKYGGSSSRQTLVTVYDVADTEVTRTGGSSLDGA